MTRRGKRLALMAAVVGLFVSATEGFGNIDLVWRPVAQSVLVGQAVDMRLYAVSDDGTNQSIGSIKAILSWDPHYLELMEDLIHNGPYAWLFSGFPNDSDGDCLNCTWEDGDALYVAFRRFAPDPPAYATPAGLLVATMRFVTLHETQLTKLDFLEQFGSTRTRVLDGLIPGLDVTGELRPAWLNILPCGHLGDMDVDCDVDLLDHADFASCLTGPRLPVGEGCERADIDGDGHVDLFDAAFFQGAFTLP